MATVKTTGRGQTTFSISMPLGHARIRFVVIAALDCTFLPFGRARSSDFTRERLDRTPRSRSRLRSRAVARPRRHALLNARQFAVIGTSTPTIVPATSKRVNYESACNKHARACLLFVRQRFIEAFDRRSSILDPRSADRCPMRAEPRTVPATRSCLFSISIVRGERAVPDLDSTRPSSSLPKTRQSTRFAERARRSRFFFRTR